MDDKNKSRFSLWLDSDSVDSRQLQKTSPFFQDSNRIGEWVRQKTWKVNVVSEAHSLAHDSTQFSFGFGEQTGFEHARESIYDALHEAISEHAKTARQYFVERIQTALIDNQRVIFSSRNQKFQALVVEWRRIRGEGSSTSPLVNDAYGQIVAMGWKVVPLLLIEVSKESGQWFTALKWITSTSFSVPGQKTSARELRDLWLNWGINNDYFSDSSRALVEREHPRIEGGTVQLD